MSIKRQTGGWIFSAVLLSGVAQAAERDYIGWPYDMKTFPLCQRYGCKQTDSKQLGGQDGSFLSLQLLNFDARLTLVLAPDKTVMGIYALLPGQNLSKTAQTFLQRVMVKSANEDFDPSLLPKCFGKISVPQGNFGKRQIILANNHYGVQCLRKRENRVNYWGVWVFFDY